MENKWLRLSLILTIGIIICIFILSLLNYFTGSMAMYPSTMMGTMNYGINYGANHSMNYGMYNNMYNGMNYGMNMGSNDIQQQLADIKGMISVGMPTAIALGIINFWRSFNKK